MIRIKRPLWVKLLSCAMSLSSCASLKKSPAKKSAEPVAAATNHKNIEFIGGIITSRQHRRSNPVIDKEISIPKNISRGSAKLENAQSWQFKYAQLLDVSVEDVINEKLYGFIEEWWGTPYRLGGKTRNGIDCSGFVNALLNTVFQLDMAGNTSAQLYNQVQIVETHDLREGDLVFFKIYRHRISHVGIYLENDKFVHASTSAGVIISDLKEPYWKKFFAGGGRLL